MRSARGSEQTRIGARGRHASVHNAASVKGGRGSVVSATRAPRTLAALVLLGIANHSVLTASRITISLDALSLGASAFTVGVLMSLYALLPMLSAVAVGRLSDRAGVRPPMLIGSIGLAVGALLPCMIDGLSVLYAS